MSPIRPILRPPLWMLFSILYGSWGSTFLAIRFANETLPPLLTAGTRFVVAGGFIYFVLRRVGVQIPDVRSWGRAATSGVLLISLGVGSLSWSLESLPSGTAALFIGTIPIWMVILERLQPGARPLRKQVVSGLVLGLSGLFAVTRSTGSTGIPVSVLPLPVVVLLFGCVAWAIGSMQSRQRPPQAPLLMSAAMQMLCGGSLLVLVSTVSGEWRGISLSDVSIRSIASLGYLIGVGTIVGYSVYAHLLRVSSLSRVGTFAYVNPVVALVLGWAVGGETLSAGVIGGAATTLSGVLLMKVDFGSIFDRLIDRVPVAPRRTLTAVRSHPSRRTTRSA